MASEKFINECKNRTKKSRIGKINADNFSITGHDNLSQFSIESGCYIDGSIIGSVYAKCLTGELVGLPEEKRLSEKIIQIETGIEYENGEIELLDLGNYLVERPINEETSDTYKITAYDALYTNLDKPYICGINYEQGNITLKDLYVDVCSQLGLTPKTLDFLNSNIPIKDNPFTNREKNRLVLKTIATIACSFVVVDDLVIDLSWIEDKEEPDYIYEMSDYAILVGGEIQYGPINNVILKNSEVDDENVSQQDDESIQENGEHSIIISEDYILYNEELRRQALPAIFNRLNGFKYIDCELTTYYGKPFHKIGDKIRIIKDKEGNYFDTYILQHKFTYDGTYLSEIKSHALTEQEIKTKQDVSLGQMLYDTQIKINKQEHTIEEVIIQQDSQAEQLAQTIMNVDNIQSMFQITGGSNLIKNSQFLLPDKVWEFEEKSTNSYQNLGAGYNSSLIGKTISISNIILRNIKMTSTIENINNIKLNTEHTLRYFITNDDLTTTRIKLIAQNTEDVIFDKTYSEQVEMQEEIIKFVSNDTNYRFEIETTTTNTGYVKIYDLMLNTGDIKPWEPASSEVYSTVLKMSQLGLQIYASGAKTLTLMTSMGFKVYKSLNGEIGKIITELTDEGIITNIATMNKTIVADYVSETLTMNNIKHHVEYFRG